MYKAILFDLDGTLTDSGEGIIKSVQYALEKLGRPEEDPDKLRCFVGPPLMTQFMSYAGLTEEEAIRAVEIYRERYLPIGIYENEVYAGIPEMLKVLGKAGYRLAVASSKPDALVHQVLEYFQLAGYFEHIQGCDPDKPHESKTDVIEAVLTHMGLSDRRNEVLMVGDTHYDVLGARAAGMECLAVTYGYDDPAALRASDPYAMADSPEAVTDFFGAVPAENAHRLQLCGD